VAATQTSPRAGRPRSSPARAAGPAIRKRPCACNLRAVRRR